MLDISDGLDGLRLDKDALFPLATSSVRMSSASNVCLAA